MGLFTFTKQATALFPCDAGLLYEVLTDYDSYSEWMPLITRSKLLAREGDLAIAEFEMQRPAKESFVVECIHTKNRLVLWRPIRGRLPITEIQCQIEKVDSQQTRVSLQLSGERTWKVPMYSEFMKLPRVLMALKSQVAAFLPGAPSGAEGAPIMEIAETAEGLVCWLHGKKYILTPAPEGKHD